MSVPVASSCVVAPIRICAGSADATTVGTTDAGITMSSVPGQLFASTVFTVYVAGPVTVVEAPVAVLLHVMLLNVPATERTEVSSGHRLGFSLTIVGKTVAEMTICFAGEEVTEHPVPLTSE